jgi:hypothetical protein
MIAMRTYKYATHKSLNYLAFQSFGFERTSFELYQKRVACTKFDMYVFIK